MADQQEESGSAFPHRLPGHAAYTGEEVRKLLDPHTRAAWYRRLVYHFGRRAAGSRVERGLSMGMARGRTKRLARLAALLAPLALAAPAPADGATFANRTISARELEDGLRRDGALKLRSVVVKGEVTLGNLAAPASFDTLSGVDVTFEGAVSIAVDSDAARIDLTRAAFRRQLIVFPAQLDWFSCVECTFVGDASLASMTVRDLDLVASTFNAYADFRSLTSTERFSIANVSFRDRADFSAVSLETVFLAGLRPSQPIEIEWDAFGDRWIATMLEYAEIQTDTEEAFDARVEEIETELRFWKRNFSEGGRESDAREVNFEIIKLRRDYLYDPWSTEWVISWILQVPSRFGTRPYRPFWIALGVILLFALVYAAARPFVRSKPNEGAASISPSPLFALLYSVDTFVPLVGTGVKDWGWDIAPAKSVIRWVAALESLIGFVVTALAAYSVGSYLL